MADSRVCAIVVGHDRPHEIRLVIDALLGQSYPLQKIIVVDNASMQPIQELIADRIRQTEIPIELARMPSNFGGAGGFARGMQLALQHEADWFWLMDDDAIPETDALAELMSHRKIDNHGPIGSVSPSVYENNKIAPMHRRYFNFWFGSERPVSKSMYTAPWVRIHTSSFVGMLVSSKAVQSIGIPNADFFLSYDDTDFSLRLLKAGFENYLIPSSHIMHLRPEGARLRNCFFGVRHYYNIRNRIITIDSYTRFRTLARGFAILKGILLWLASRGYVQAHSLRVLRSAILDGLNHRLGSVEA